MAGITEVETIVKKAKLNPVQKTMTPMNLVTNAIKPMPPTGMHCISIDLYVYYDTNDLSNND